jgi:hypothetical protein
MRGIASALPAGDPRRARLLALADAHAVSGLARVASGNYEGEHWLASFAVYLLTVEPAPAAAARPAPATAPKPAGPPKREPAA